MVEKKRTKLFHHLKKWMEMAVMDYTMIEEGDKVLVGVSGGADSIALLELLKTPMVFVPPFSILAVNIDLGFDPTYNDYNRLETYLKDNHYSYVMDKTDIGLLLYSIGVDGIDNGGEQYNQGEETGDITFAVKDHASRE